MVATELGLRTFDDRRAGRKLVARTMRELKALRAVDPRIESVRAPRRLGPGADSVEITVTVRAVSPWAAYEIGAAAVRTAIHAAGGATAGWERSCPRVLDAAGWPRPATWDQWSAKAARSATLASPLPPFGMPADVLIDLR